MRALRSHTARGRAYFFSQVRACVRRMASSSVQYKADAYERGTCRGPDSLQQTKCARTPASARASEWYSAPCFAVYLPSQRVTSASTGSVPIPYTPLERVLYCIFTVCMSPLRVSANSPSQQISPSVLLQGYVHVCVCGKQRFLAATDRSR